MILTKLSSSSTFAIQGCARKMVELAIDKQKTSYQIKDLLWKARLRAKFTSFSWFRLLPLRKITDSRWQSCWNPNVPCWALSQWFSPPGKSELIWKGALLPITPQILRCCCFWNLRSASFLTYSAIIFPQYPCKNSTKNDTIQPLGDLTKLPASVRDGLVCLGLQAQPPRGNFTICSYCPTQPENHGGP